jgi:hypothetical protein
MAHTVSAIGEYESCERRYRYKYVDLVRPRIHGKALNVGTLLHSALEEFSNGASADEALEAMAAAVDGHEYFGTDDGTVEYHRTRAMVRAYFSRWAVSRERWEVVGVEREFAIELAPGVAFAGKIDLIARADGRLYVWDHKTTSDEVGNVGTDFWQRLAIDKQIAAYSEATLREYGEMPSILWDVVKKPAGKPKGKVKIARRKTESDAEYEARKAANLETLPEFEDRLAQEMTAKPDECLVRREVHRTREQHAELMSEIVETCNRIQEHKGCWTRNDKACRSYGSTCAYLGVCAGVEGLDSERFEKLETANPELQAREVTDELDSCPL